MTAKEALNNVCYGYGFDDNIAVLESTLNRSEELEKVLKIIKNKPTTIGLCLASENKYKGFFMFDTYEEYQKSLGRWYKPEYMYNETEFNLLKEYLK